MSAVVNHAKAERRKAFIAGLCHPYNKDQTNPFPSHPNREGHECWKEYEAGKKWALENGNKELFIN